MPGFRSSKRLGQGLHIAGIALLGSLLGCTANRSGVHGSNDVQAPRITREDLRFAIGKGIGTVEIDNQFGQITVRDHDRDEVGIHGVVQSLPPHFGTPRVVHSDDGDTLRITVSLPDRKAGGRYDLAAYVPSGMNLVIRGNEDRVDARKRAGALTASTVSGDIHASSSSRLDLTTTSGTIKATALNGDWAGRSRIHSLSGRIVALLPLYGNVSVEAETGGRLVTDFGLSVHPRPNSGGHVARARYGSGTSEIYISSDSGEVILEQAVLLEQDGDSAADLD